MRKSKQKVKPQPKTPRKRKIDDNQEEKKDDEAKSQTESNTKNNEEPEKKRTRTESLADDKKSEDEKPALWSLELTWNGGRKMETRSVHWSIAEANEAARKFYDSLPDKDTEDVTNDGTTPNEPYQVFTCVGSGQSSVLITVEMQPHFLLGKLKADIIKDLLKKKGLDTKGTKKVLLDRLLANCSNSERFES
jgi:hypothetical protein